jgi:DNA-binding response OmpR family regulator
MPKIIIVEDDPAIAEMLQYHLQSLNYDITHFDNGAVARDYLQEGVYDLVLLDIMLPDYNGLDLCRELRQSRPSVPIMLLTSLDSEADRVVGLELGADDYLTKPFSMRECQARIKALLRRCELNTQDATVNKGLQEENTNPLLRYEELSLSLTTREVLLEGQPIELTQREFDLLYYFINHQQQVFSRGQLLNAVWGYSHDGYEATVNTHINRLRKKLKRTTDKEDFIKTVWGVGYKFIA